MDLPTYTNIWRIEKRLYKLYDFRLPMPLPLGQIAVFTAIAVPYVVVLAVLGLPFSHTLLWLYVLPPGVLTWLATRPVLESKRLPELVSSQLRYLGEPRTWCRMAPHAEQDEVVVTARVWRRAARAEREDQIVPDTVAGRDDVAAGAAQDAVAEPDGLAGHAVRDGDANRERRADRRERRAGQEERELEVAAQSAMARAAHGVQPIGVTAQARTTPPVRAPAVPGPVVPGSAVRAPAMPGSAVPGPAVRAPAVPGPAVPGTAVPGRAVAGSAGPAPAAPPPAHGGSPGRWPVLRSAPRLAPATQQPVPQESVSQQPMSQQSVRQQPVPRESVPQQPGLDGSQPVPSARPPAPEPAAARQVPVTRPHAQQPSRAAEPAAARPGRPWPAVAQPVRAAGQPAPQPVRAAAQPAPQPVRRRVSLRRSRSGRRVSLRRSRCARPDHKPLEPGQAPGPLPPATGPARAADPQLPAAHRPVPAWPGRPNVIVNEDRSAQRAVPMVEGALSNPAVRRAEGWRDRVVVVPGGHRPGQPDQLQRDRDRARLPVSGTRRIVVLGCTVGAGQSVTTLRTGELLASLRDEAVAVLDLNPGQNSLSERARAIPALTGGSQAGPGTEATPSRLEVITNQPDDPSGAAASAGGPAMADAAQIFEVLAARYSLTLADPAAAAVPRVLSVADQLLLVAPASAEAASAIAMTMEWLEAHGHGALAASAITVLNGVSRPTMAYVEQAETVAAGRCRAIVRVPWDGQLKNPEVPGHDGAAPGGPVHRTPAALAGAAAERAYTALAGVLVASLVAAPGSAQAELRETGR